MPFLALPWVVGPVPIILTVWAAYACGKAVVKQRPTTGEAFAGALLLPGGLTSIGSQLFLSQNNFTAVLICNQIISSVCFLIIMRVSGFRRASFLSSKSTSPAELKRFVILVVSYILFNMIIWWFPGANRCTIAKCFVYELALGRIDQFFAKMYPETLFGALMLVGILSFVSYASLAAWRGRGVKSDDKA